MGNEQRSGSPNWLDRVRSIVVTVSKYGGDVTELEVEQDGLRIRLKRKPSSPSTTSSKAQEESSVEPYEDESRYYKVKAPFTGIFYAQERPDLPQLVKEGEYVEKGQLVGIIETMKVFNRIESDEGGLLVKVVVQNSALVHGEDTLMILDKKAPKSQTIFRPDI